MQTYPSLISPLHKFSILKTSDWGEAFPLFSPSLKFQEISSIICNTLWGGGGCITTLVMPCSSSLRCLSARDSLSLADPIKGRNILRYALPGLRYVGRSYGSSSCTSRFNTNRSTQKGLKRIYPVDGGTSVPWPGHLAQGHSLRGIVLLHPLNCLTMGFHLGPNKR